MANTPLFMKDASITIVIPPGPIAGAVEYNCDVSTAEVLSAPGDDVTYQTLCPDGTMTQKGASTYSLHLVGVQDWGTEGLSRFLWENAGEEARVIVQAHGAATAIGADAPGFDCNVVLIEGTYGGEAKNWAEFDVELPCTVRPVLLTVAPTVEETAAPAEEQTTLDSAAA